jgi:hypothetical protein
MKQFEIEIHRMSGSKRIPTWCKVDGKRIYLTTFFEDVGIKLKVRQQVDLPPSTPVSKADLHGLLWDFLDLNADPPVIHAVVAARFRNDNGSLSSAQGMMFDDSQRSAFAIFDFGSPSNANMLLNTIHELTHVFNLHHEDGELRGTKTTIEGRKELAKTDWMLGSHARNRHFDERPDTVWPGPNGTPFSSHLNSHN